MRGKRIGTALIEQRTFAGAEGIRTAYHAMGLTPPFKNLNAIAQRPHGGRFAPAIMRSSTNPPSWYITPLF